MPNFSGNQKKTSSDSKRHFTVVMGNKEHGLYISSTPSSAAKKVAKKLCTSNKGKKVEFSLREITQGSKKKVYGPYIGYIEKLKDSGKIVVKKKKLSKKGGMKGGEGIDDIKISLGDCGRKKKKLFSFSGKKNFKNCIVLSVNSRKITINNHDGKIIVKYFDKIDTNIYYLKEKYSITGTSLSDFCKIIKKLLNESEETLDDSKCISLIGRIKDYISNPSNKIYTWLNYIYQIYMASPQPSRSTIQYKTPVNQERARKYQENLDKQKKYQENLNRTRADPTIAKQKANNEIKRRKETLLNLSQWAPTSDLDQGSGLEHRTNYSKQPTYQSYTLGENTHYLHND